MSSSSNPKKAVSRSTRRSRHQKHERPPIPTEETIEKTVHCQSFASFISDSAASIDKPFVFLVSGNHKKSLFFRTMLTTRNYSALLLGCGLVKCREMSDGSIQVESSEAIWKDFLYRYHLDGSGDGCSEATRGNFILMHSKIKKGRRKWRRHLQRVVGRIGSVSLHYESENTKQKEKPSELLRQSTKMLTLLLFAIK